MMTIWGVKESETLKTDVGRLDAPNDCTEIGDKNGDGFGDAEGDGDGFEAGDEDGDGFEDGDEDGARAGTET